MKHSVVIIIFLCICLLYPTLGSASESTIEVYSSSVVKRNSGDPLQVGIIKISDRRVSSIDVELKFPEGDVTLNFSNLKESNHTVSFEFPLLKERINVQVSIAEDGATIYEEVVTLKPPKMWKIYDTQVSHHDLGYADYYHMMRRDVREMGIEMAMEFARRTDGWPEESQFHWTIETSEPMIKYLSEQPDSILQELFNRVEKGQISIGGIHNSATSEHMGYELMARQFYTPNRYVCDWFNTKPSKTALNDDIVGFSRALALYSKEADIPYFMFGRNTTAKQFDKAEDDAAFYWQSPDRDSKMTLFKIWGYYSEDRLKRYNLQEISALCGRYESHKNYPYSCILAEDSYDFGLPEFENVEGIKKWNEEYSNPVLVSGTFDMYFDDLNSQQEIESFKTFDKDAPNAWADEDLTDVEYANRARILNSSLPTTEKWATIASAVTAGSFPWIDIYQSYFSLLSWAEHTNGAYAEGPIYSPPSLDDSSAANAAYYDLEQEMHRDLIRESELFKNRAERVAVKQLESQITTISENTLVVNNPLVRRRSDYVTFETTAGGELSKITDNTTGSEVLFQYIDDRTVLLYAEEVPSLGYKTYTLELGDIERGSTFEIEESPIVENEFYIIEFDSISGGIKSMLDKKLGRELVDQDARFKLNEYYYERFETESYKTGITKYQAEKASFKVQHGPLADIVISEVEAEGAEDIIQTVTIYKDSNQIDFKVTFDKDDSGRTLDDYRNYSPKGKEGLFYCLPFNVPNFTIKHELAGGIIEPIEDQFKGSSTDYYGIQNFSDISNEEWGVTLATIEPNLIEYGTPRPAYWSRGDDYEHIMEKAEDSHFYLYLLNNMFFTNVRLSQPGVKSFRWSVRSHKGDWKCGKAYQFGRDISNPFTTFISKGEKRGLLPSTSKSFVELDSDDILCSTIKPAESNGEGYIMRFVEVSGEEQIVTVNANFIESIESVNLTNLVEVDRDYPLEMVGDKSFKFTIPAFGLRTVRVVPSKVNIPDVIDVKAVAVSDREIKLSWNLSSKRDDKIAYYRVYRGLTPHFTPSIRTYVNSSDCTEFIDKPVLNIRGWQSNNLNPETQYYYKVVAVGVDNRVSQISTEVSVKTRKSIDINQEPNQVLGLVSALVSKITDHNYVGLYFYTNVEQDIDRYIIYRSEESGFVPKESDIIYEMDLLEEIEHITPHGFGKVTRPLKAYNRQLFIDEDIQPYTTYYYRVAAVDDAGQIGRCSQESSTTTTVANLKVIGETSFRDSSKVTISNPNSNSWNIRYTTDGSTPTKESKLYTKPLNIDGDITLIASLFKPDNDEGVGTVVQEFMKMKNYEITYNLDYHPVWRGVGDISLIDCYRGDDILNSRWQGFSASDMDITIDMKELKEVESVSVGCLQNAGSSYFFPNYIEVSISENGVDFIPAGRLETIKEWQRLELKVADLIVSFPKAECRYIRVFVKSIGYNPVWHKFAGNDAWLFVDEVTIK